ncbi:glycosyltransferase [Acetobacter fallax]|uniref:Glycosyltransferase n=1 Tax=Acetobacter fallax TaxID=1737473 RepID=A0ABX0KDW0_9PROT|nr:glycosyltransferase [Acetobacter fallax]NHO32655.1 glycosyltransferase [Acetobacter fallax]NHO36285.1 glycosyltransferase [Acetobacter fallax]
MINVFVQLSYGYGARNWNEKFRNGKILGTNEPYAYGYYRGASDNIKVTYSEDIAKENLFEKSVRYIARLILGFDFIQVWRNRKQITSGTDVVWTYNESQTLGVMLLKKLLHLNRIKVIGQSVWLIDKWPHNRLRQKFYRWLLKDVDVLTFNSKINSDIARRMFPGNRVEFTKFGIRCDEMVPYVAKDVGNIIAVGNDRSRDWTTLAGCASQMMNTKFLLATQNASAIAIASKHVNMEIAGLKTNDDMAAFYAKAILIIVPLKRNNYVSGLTVVEEAGVMGVPCIVTDTGGLRDYFADDMVYFVPPDDPEALTKAVQDLLQDKERRGKMVKNMQDYMRSSLNSETYVDEYVRITHQLV